MDRHAENTINYKHMNFIRSLSINRSNPKKSTKLHLINPGNRKDFPSLETKLPKLQYQNYFYLSDLKSMPSKKHERSQRNRTPKPNIRQKIQVQEQNRRAKPHKDGNFGLRSHQETPKPPKKIPPKLITGSNDPNTPVKSDRRRRGGDRT